MGSDYPVICSPMLLMLFTLFRNHDTHHRGTDCYAAPKKHSVGCFTIYLILLGWKSYKQYYEIDELPKNPTPTQPKKN